MLKNILLLTLLSSLSIASKAQTGWVKQKFGDKLTISFPTEAKKASESTYVARDSAGIVYGVVIMEIDQSAYTTTSSSDTALVRLKFIDEVVESVKAKMPKYAIGDLKINEVNKTKTYSLNGKNEENQSTVHLNIFLIGDVSYSLTCFLPAGVDGKNKDAFLNSFVIAK